MIAPGNDLFQALLAIAFVIASGYALGRIHQWYRDGAAREESYRSGYDRASDHMLDMALRKQAAEAPTMPADLVGSTDTPPRKSRLVAARVTTVEVPPGRPQVGHARRRIIAGQLGCAPGNVSR